MDSIFHSQKGSWKDREQRCRHETPWARIIQTNQKNTSIDVQSPFKGDTWDDEMQGLCAIQEKTKKLVSEGTEPLHIRAAPSGWAGPKLVAVPRKPIEVLLGQLSHCWGIWALYRAWHAACCGTNTNLSQLYCTVQSRATQVIREASRSVPGDLLKFHFANSLLVPVSQVSAQLSEIPISTVCQNNPF